MLGSLSTLRCSRGEALNIGTLALAVVAAYAAAQFILTGNIIGLSYIGLFVLGVFAVVASLKDWRSGLYLFLAWLLFEDLVRKYLGNNMAIYFGKDLLVLVLYVSFFLAKRAAQVKTFRPPFLIPLVAFFWIGLLQVFNPGSTSIFYGLMGMKLYFLYVPLFYLGYGLIDSDVALRRFFQFNSFLILIVVGLGVAQSLLGHTFLNPAVIQDDIRGLSTIYRVAPISGLIAYRPTSVFVSAGRFQNFLIISWLLALGFGGYLVMRRRQGRTFAYITVGVVAAGSLLTASRGVFMWNAAGALIIAALFLWGAPWRNREGFRVARAIQRSTLFVGISVVILLTLFPNELNSRLAIYSETLSPTSPTSELFNRTRDYPMANFLAAFDYPGWPYGYGIGTSSLGAQYVTRLLHAAPMGVAVENGYGQLILELGLLGLIMWIVLAVAISLSAWRALKNLKGSPWFPIGAGIFWFTFLLLIPMSYYGFTAYQDFVMNAYFWLLLGILFRLQTEVKSMEFDRCESRKGRTLQGFE
jgi:hypothetical protein